MRLPSFDSVGARKIWPPLRFSVSSGCAKVRGRSSIAACGRYLAFTASRQSSLSSWSVQAELPLEGAGDAEGR